MKIIIYGICLTLLLLSNASAKELNTIEAEVLTKTIKSRDGNELPDYAKGKPEISILKIIIPPETKFP
jgi:hypothetical protein